MRHTSSEVSPQEFCDTEFQDHWSGKLDRAISAYRIEELDIVRSHAEHYAGASLDPKGRPDLDLDGLAATVASVPLTGWPFGLTAAAHCEIRCDSDQEVLALALRLFQRLAERTHDVTKSEIQAYVRAAIATGDREWRAFLAKPGVKETWKRLAGMV